MDFLSIINKIYKESNYANGVYINFISVEDNINITSALKSGVEAGKEISTYADELAEVTSDLRDQKEVMEEFSSNLKEIVF